MAEGRPSGLAASTVANSASASRSVSTFSALARSSGPVWPAISDQQIGYGVPVPGEIRPGARRASMSVH